MNNDQRLFLENKALNLRIDSIRATSASKSGHPTSCLSAADLIAALFFNVLKHDLKNPKAANNDRFIMSKGHAIPVVYAAYKALGVISDHELLSLRKFDSVFEGHPTPRFIYNEAATGSLGQGLGVGLGMALHAKHHKLNFKTYVMMGDGEIAEGSIWEAADLAAHYNVDNLIGIVDCNRLAQSDEGINGHHVEKIAAKFEAFGWKAFVIHGHDMTEIMTAFHEAQQAGKPAVIVAKTFKGHGLAGIENKLGFHGKPFSTNEEHEAIEKLKSHFKEAYEYNHNLDLHKIHAPETTNLCFQKQQPEIKIDLASDPQAKHFGSSEKIATRQAFGYALAALGRANKAIFALDADVQNSTYTEYFEREFPDRFVQCFVAEQNMISVATGLQARGNIPFAATFAAFYTRAHDQIRMAGIGRNALRLCGSHVGVSIGEDGPSQMGLEDIALFRSVPNSIVLYPSDGVSTYKLTQEMANYHDGVSYLRTTRAATANLYDACEEFPVGGCKVLHQTDDQDIVCVIAAGITLHEALKAYKLLKEQGIHIAVIDLYSIKPIDAKTIIKVANKSHHGIITIEDHYSQGGIGEAVAHAVANENITVKSLAVQHISRSGAPAELLADAGIDAQSIVDAVQTPCGQCFERK
ncbi:transketolase [Candidatus Babeliales bacterium]|nr:transketolase [Candidatus Babeliales bacterium]